MAEADPQETGTRKRKRGGKRAKNKLIETVYTVREVGVAGEPLEPIEVRAKFRNAVGVVPKSRKDFLRAELRKWFQFPHGTEEKAKAYALKQMGCSYRKWKTDLTNKYLKNDLTPFEEYAQWDEFKRQRTTKQAIKLSKANSALAKRDMHKKHLGPAGEDLISKGLPDPYEGLNERTFQWIKVPGGERDFAKPQTKEAEQEKEDKFVSEREQDALTQRLGTKEHGGRVIKSPTPCELHILLGIHGRTEEVAKTIAISGSGIFHGTPIPPEYARVEILSVEAKHEEEMIGIPTPEGIHFLGQSVKQFILWNKKYILNLTPQEQLQESGQLAIEHADPICPEHVVEKPDTPLEAVEKPDTPPEAEKPAVAKEVTPPAVPTLVRTYEKDAISEVDKWLKKKQAGKDKELTTKSVPVPDLKDYKSFIGLDKIADLPDCPVKYECGKPFLPDWALNSEYMPGEMKRFHNWYLRASRLGVSSVMASIPSRCFNTLTKSTIVDFSEFHNMFRLGQVDITAMTLWCI
ncbi:hypothetical protein U9M48_039297 [Paspalum notatum var. saurae]|uniref:DUF8039 domain-containing protein n=1 Tax=Paspalum notatum var. saurae TaxID=547442 RepID=A0AAQ3UL44_PASNO